MFRHSLPLVLCAAACLVVPQAVRAEFKLEYDKDAKWAEFAVGSWKLVRVYRDAIDHRGRVKSTGTEEIRSTLIDRNEVGYRIRIDVTAEIAGRRYDQESRYVTKQWNGKDGGQFIELEEAGSDAVVIDGHDYPTQRRSILIQSMGVTSRSSIWYSPHVSPYVLKMETSYLDEMGQTQRGVEMDVISVEMPHKVLADIKATSHVRIREKSYATGGETITVEVQCPDVPGWVVSRSTKLLDKDARVVQRTTLELVDFGAEKLNDTKKTSRLERRRDRQEKRQRSR